jgi:fucose permease
VPIAIIIATLYLQDARGWSALHTAAAFWPCGILGLFVAPRLAALIERFSLQVVLAAGLALAAITYVLMLPIGLGRHYWTGLFPSFALIGIAFGLAFSRLNISATSGVEPHEQGSASGLVQTAIQFGTALPQQAVVRLNRSFGLPPFSRIGDQALWPRSPGRAARRAECTVQRARGGCFGAA